MKLKDIQVGGRYACRVGQQVQTVRVVEIKEIPPASWSARSAWRTLIYAVNEATGRKITIRSPQRLRRRIGDGCEFCCNEANRPAGEFKCPYCRKAWAGGP